MNKGIYNNKLRAAKRRIFQTLKKEGYEVNGVKHSKLISEYFNMYDIQRPIELRWQDFIIKLYEAGELGDLEPFKQKKDVPAYRKKYLEYLSSKEWRQFRLTALDFYGNKCGLCDSTDSLDLHHKTYKNLFHETFADVIPLCKKCHTRHHGK